MRRITYWLLATVSAFVLLFGFDASQRGATGGAPAAAISGGSAGTSDGSGSGGQGQGTNDGSADNGSDNGSNGSGNGSSNGSSNGSAGSATRTVTGSVAQTQWGPVQVQLAIDNGSIAKVTVLQYPHSNSRDIEIARYSLPTLIQETMQSQSAQIDMVSGATYTSAGYIESLQSALDQADL